ncbi:MAG TPA: hypothetical protein VFQ41_03690 [Candidatus Angelobacter sp.]|nr:hypothetical protein [Candidatus Angelobacter sp.]
MKIDFSTSWLNAFPITAISRDHGDSGDGRALACGNSVLLDIFNCSKCCLTNLFDDQGLPSDDGDVGVHARSRRSLAAFCLYLQPTTPRLPPM